MKKWKCKHCNKQFDFESVSEKANHSRWCNKNPNRNSSVPKLIEAQNKIYGGKKYFEVNCDVCGIKFEVLEREKLFPSKNRYFCSRKCSNSIGGKAKAKKYYSNARYTTIAWKYHDKKCIVCNEDKIVSVHHYNEIHTDNRPENLVPLCPTHHQYIHSRYKWVIEKTVDDYVEDKVIQLGR